ncbi:unnamed protein product [Nesidiocoris tenuis]|uniref:Uncharacterized protein n=1 Tax=Nesidiocoris tenuis TaxID=355587 RepID=A0A6H5G7B9_9HEMI|nr:unnamed protein product [Nesidiocoris tenuis]
MRLVNSNRDFPAWPNKPLVIRGGYGDCVGNRYHLGEDAHHKRSPRGGGGVTSVTAEVSAQNGARTTVAPPAGAGGTVASTNASKRNASGSAAVSSMPVSAIPGAASGVPTGAASAYRSHSISPATSLPASDRSLPVSPALSSSRSQSENDEDALVDVEGRSDVEEEAKSVQPAVKSVKIKKSKNKEKKSFSVSLSSAGASGGASAPKSTFATPEEILARLPPLDISSIDWTVDETPDDETVAFKTTTDVTDADVDRILNQHVEGLNGEFVKLLIFEGVVPTPN